MKIGGDYIMRIVVFGTGTYYERFRFFLQNYEIVALLDNNQKKHGQYKDGYLILPPHAITTLTYDEVIILASLAIAEMKKQLIKEGVPPEKIKTLYDMVYMKDLSLYKHLEIYCSAAYYHDILSNSRKKIAILTYGLGVGGGDLILLNVVEAMKEHYNVHVVSSKDGPIKKDIGELGVPVIIDKNLEVVSFAELKWLDYYDGLFINGTAFATLFAKGPCRRKAIWWLHSSGFMNDDHADSLQNIHNRGILQKNVSVYGVSDRAVDSFLTYVPSWKAHVMCYGIHDKYTEDKEQATKIIFAVVGSCQPRKGQDIFIEATDLLTEKEKECCEFWLIGPMMTNSFTDKIKEAVNSSKKFKIFGFVYGEQKKHLYEAMSVLVCPSIEDTMPIVCAEAMMYHKPCIVSDHTGTAKYIMEKENGLICRANEPQDLAEKMRWIISNHDKIKRMGDCARKTYETQYSFTDFKASLLNIVGEVIG